MPTNQFSVLDEDEEFISSYPRHASWRRFFHRRNKVLWALASLILLTLFLALLLGFAMKAPKNPPLQPEEDFISQMHDLYLNTIDAAKIGATIKYYSSKPHIAGSEQNYQLGLETKRRFEEYGFTTRMEEHKILLSYPLTRSVVLRDENGDTLHTCDLEEKLVNDGTDPQAFANAAPPFNGYSGSGEAESELIYVNYGREEDFQLLESRYSLNFTGKVVLVRYGMIFRGNKALSAEKRGAKGVLILTDRMKGDLKGPVYPTGPWSTNTTVQRGTIWTGNGDPTTPGWPSTPTGPRLSIAEAHDPAFTSDPLPNIPVLPISYGDALILVGGFNSKELPSSWAGEGLNLQYITGPQTVKMEVQMNETLVTVYNVIGVMEGSEEADRLVILGAHRDAWTFGAVDPISGTSVLMETARSLGTLFSRGWRPHSWDAEEWGLEGSVEFSELHEKTLTAKAVAYLNLDTAVTGNDVFYTQGSPSFFKVLQEVTKKVQFSGKDLESIWYPETLLLGSGSDHSSFIHRLGITSLSMGIAGEDERYEAVYHSNYDSYYWVEHFGDPGFVYHSLTAKAYGLLALRLADDSILPLDFVHYADSLHVYLEQILVRLNRFISSDQTITNPGNRVDPTPMITAMETFKQAASSVQKEVQSALVSHTLTSFQRRNLNDRLMLTERTFLGNEKESGRSWHRHIVFSPSLNNSYDATPFPALFGALAQQDYTLADFLIRRFGQMITQAAEFLQSTHF